MPRTARYDSSTASSSSSTSESSDSDDEKRILPATRSRTRRRKEKERENVEVDSSGSEDEGADLEGKPRKYREARRAKAAKGRRRRKKKAGNDNVHLVLVCLAILAVALLLVASGYYVWKDRELLFETNTTPDGSNQSGFIGSNPDPSPTLASLPVPAILTTSTIFSSNSPASITLAPLNPLPSSNTNVSTITTGTAKNCFPFGGAQLPSTGVPTIPQSSWWCPPSEMYGFLGFSYPMEISDCSDRTNGFDAISKDFAKMKTFGATLVRVYAPQCGKVSVWENLVKAGVANNMGVIVQVWWGFGQPPDELFQQTRTAIYSLFTTSSYAAIAKFVVQSAAFGSEPIGDGVDGNQVRRITPSPVFLRLTDIRARFLVCNGRVFQFDLKLVIERNLIRSLYADLTAFKIKMNSFGIPVAISEDWDRPESMSTSSGALGTIGQQIAANTDMVQAHIMPYYHGIGIGNAWSYTQKQVSWLRKTVNKPLIFLTECPWSSQSGGSHDTDKSAETLPNFKTYWNSFAENCALFKSQQVGWFLHTFDDGQEPYFGLIDGQGESKIPNFLPVRC